MRISLTALAAGALVSACAGGSAGPAPAAAPAPVAAPAPAARQAAPTPTPAPAPAPAAAPAAAKAFDPSGAYSVSITYGGMPLVITINLGKRADGSYGGAITVDQVPDPIPLTSVTVTANRVQATLNSPDGATVSMDFTITGADLTGAYKSSNGDGSAMAGKKLP